jgi:hypothetical protein
MLILHLAGPHDIGDLTAYEDGEWWRAHAGSLSGGATGHPSTRRHRSKPPLESAAHG